MSPRTFLRPVHQHSLGGSSATAWLLTTATLLWATAALAQPMDLELDPEATAVAFELGATGHDVHGVFEMSSGSLSFDPTTGEASGEIVVDALSGNSGSAQRDKKMHKKVLESDSFRTITFRADRLEGEVALDGPSDFELVGELTLLGEAHPLTMPVHAEIQSGQVTASTQFEVPYIEWGLHNPSLLVLRVAKTVVISIETHGELAGAPAGTSSEPSPDA